MLLLFTKGIIEVLPKMALSSHRGKTEETEENQLNGSNTETAGREGGKPPKTVTFVENAVYDVERTAAILNRCPKTVRAMCRRGVIRARQDRGGYFITGWAIREYAENRLVITEK